VLTAEDNYRIGTNLYGKNEIYITVDAVVKAAYNYLNPSSYIYIKKYLIFNIVSKVESPKHNLVHC